MSVCCLLPAARHRPPMSCDCRPCTSVCGDFTTNHVCVSDSRDGWCKRRCGAKGFGNRPVDCFCSRRALQSDAQTITKSSKCSAATTAHLSWWTRRCNPPCRRPRCASCSACQDECPHLAGQVQHCVQPRDDAADPGAWGCHRARAAVRPVWQRPGKGERGLPYLVPAAIWGPSSSLAVQLYS